MVLAKNLLGNNTPLKLPAMLVKIKTPELPLHLAGETQRQDLRWQINTERQGMVARGVDDADQLRAFVVGGSDERGIWIVENIADVGGLLCLKCRMRRWRVLSDLRGRMCRPDKAFTPHPAMVSKCNTFYPFWTSPANQRAAAITPCPRDKPPSPAGKLCGKSNVKSAR